MSEQDFGAECAEEIDEMQKRYALSLHKLALAKIINDQLARRQPEPEPEEPRERMFGTHIREAIEAFKPLFRKDDPQPAPEPVAGEWSLKFNSIIANSWDVMEGDTRLVFAASRMNTGLDQLIYSHNASLRQANAELSRCREELQAMLNSRE